ncbi:MAG: SpoIIE family protein phosphatase [Kofleriaceae bacterium]|nr:SpoIIE family protein phosphatase [Kofleriaceae bacterium]
MKLRTGMLLGTAALVAAIVVATVVAVFVFVGRSERAKLADALTQSRSGFEDLLRYRQSVLRSDCRVVANEPRLRALVATRDISRETVIGGVSELKESLGSDLFLVADPSGRLVADAADPRATGFDLAMRPGIAEARTAGEGGAVWISERVPYQVQACRIDLGQESVGIVVVGRRFDDAAARDVFRHTGSTIAVTLDGERVAGSAETREPAAELAAAVARVRVGPAELSIAGTEVAALGGAFPGYRGKRALEFVLSRSLDEALAPQRRLTASVLVIAGFALAGAFAFAFALSRRLSRPVDDLVAFTVNVARGELAARAPRAGPAEVEVLATAMNAMLDELEKSRAQLSQSERLRREMEIATRIQTSILPRTFEVTGMQVAACMIPATEVGGDYYDVLPITGGCWIGIGDVAGHGLAAGLEMLMVQSVVAALVREAPGASPRDHVCVLNHVIHDNIRNRLRQDEHVTLTLLRCVGGTVTFAGAHEDIVVLRRGSNTCERFATPGTWLGGMRDVSHATVDTTLELGDGDVMVLYSDGVTEARGRDGRMFGVERLCAAIERHADEDVDEIRDRIIADVRAWQHEQTDDISVVVARRATV